MPLIFHHIIKYSPKFLYNQNDRRKMMFSEHYFVKKILMTVFLNVIYDEVNPLRCMFTNGSYIAVLKYSY